MERYFAYGSNMDPVQIKDRLCRVPKASSARLDGYELRFNKIAEGKSGVGWANIVAPKCDTVYGVLYEVAEGDLKKLDKCEGVAKSHYRREKVDVVLNGGKAVAAIAYVACPDWIDQSLRPTREYLSRLLAGKEYLPLEYVAKLRETACVEDAGAE